ncbi:MAG: DUF2065 domain-containing protein [Maricaulaceae bacterium]
MWRDWVFALGLVLAVEGLVYAAFPLTARRWLAALVQAGPETLRWTGLLSACVGVAILWILRG